MGTRWHWIIGLSTAVLLHLALLVAWQTSWLTPAMGDANASPLDADQRGRSVSIVQLTLAKPPMQLAPAKTNAATTTARAQVVEAQRPSEKSPAAQRPVPSEPIPIGPSVAPTETEESAPKSRLPKAATATPTEAKSVLQVVKAAPTKSPSQSAQKQASIDNTKPASRRVKPQLTPNSEMGEAAPQNRIHRDTSKHQQTTTREAADTNHRQQSRSAPDVATAISAAAGQALSVVAPSVSAKRIADIELAYAEKVRQRVVAAKRYPPQARRRGIEGEAKLQLVIGRDGRIVASTLTQRSGNRLLDGASESIVRRMAKLPPLPEELNNETLAVTIPIIYRRALN